MKKIPILRQTKFYEVSRKIEILNLLNFSLVRLLLDLEVWEQRRRGLQHIEVRPDEPALPRPSKEIDFLFGTFFTNLFKNTILFGGFSILCWWIFRSVSLMNFVQYGGLSFVYSSQHRQEGS